MCGSGGGSSSNCELWLRIVSVESNDGLSEDGCDDFSSDGGSSGDCEWWWL